jgi:hypothetical protein
MSIIDAIIIGTTIGTIAVTDIIPITALPELLPARRPMSQRSLFGCYLVFPTKDILLRRFPNPWWRRANFGTSVQGVAVQGVAVRWPAMQPWRVNLGFLWDCYRSSYGGPSRTVAHSRRNPMLRKLSLIMALISAVALPATDALARGRGGGGGGRGYGGHGYGGHVGRGAYGGRRVVRRGGYLAGAVIMVVAVITAAMAAIMAADARGFGSPS